MKGRGRVCVWGGIRVCVCVCSVVHDVYASELFVVVQEEREESATRLQRESMIRPYEFNPCPQTFCARDETNKRGQNVST